MLDSFFTFISTFWEYLKFWVVIDQYSEGVLLRKARFKRVLKPGYYFKWPFLDYSMEHPVVPTTMRLYHQSLHTKDDKPIVVQAIVKYKVTDVKTLLLEVNDPIDAIGDMTQSIIKNVIMERTWEECKSLEIDNLITKKARVEAKQWGISVLNCTLVDIAKAPSFRLMQNPIIKQDA